MMVAAHNPGSIPEVKAFVRYGLRFLRKLVSDNASCLSKREQLKGFHLVLEQRVEQFLDYRSQ